MKPSGIGGQAVIEGIMMRNNQKYSIAVRKPDQEIEVVVKESHLLTEKYPWLNYPIIRGVFNFVDSLVTGVSTISYSANFYDDPAEQKKTKADEIGKAIFKDKLEAVLMAVTVIFSIFFALALFMVLPYFISRLLAKYIVSKFLLNFIEGIIRVVIFLLYIMAISKMNDIKRTFMYHGAEHKCINCIESGAKLTPVNVKNSSRFHKRCGTSFLFFVMFVSVIFFIFIRVDNTALQIVIRLLLVPVIAGVSYEIIRWAGKDDNQFINIVSKPGLWLQRLTTKEPDMDMIEVAIQAVEAVFDPDAFLAEMYQDSEDPEAEMEAKAAELALSSNLIIDENKESRSLHPDDIPTDLKFKKPVILDDDIEEAVSDQSVQEDHAKSANQNVETDATETNVEDSKKNVKTSEASETSEASNTDSANGTSEVAKNEESSQKSENSEENVQEDEELPEGFELIEDEYGSTSVGEKIPLEKDSNATSIQKSEQADVNESDNEDEKIVDDGIEFVEEDVEEETLDDEIPLFRQKDTDD